MGLINKKAVKRMIATGMVSSSLLGAGALATATPAHAMEVNIGQVNTAIVAQEQGSDSFGKLVQIVITEINAQQQAARRAAEDRQQPLS